MFAENIPDENIDTGRATLIDIHSQAFVQLSSTRLTELQTVIDNLDCFDADLTDAEEWKKLFTTVVKSLELSDIQLAKLLECSRPTISRWLSGKNAPSPSGRKSTLNLLTREAKRKLRRREGVPLIAAE